MRKQVEERTCDLCAVQVNGEAGKAPLGWRTVEVADETRKSGRRDICPFCWEALEAAMAAHPDAGTTAKGAKVREGKAGGK